MNLIKEYEIKQRVIEELKTLFKQKTFITFRRRISQKASAFIDDVIFLQHESSSILRQSLIVIFSKPSTVFSNTSIIQLLRRSQRQRLMRE